MMGWLRSGRFNSFFCLYSCADLGSELHVLVFERVFGSERVSKIWVLHLLELSDGRVSYSPEEALWLHSGSFWGIYAYYLVVDA